MWKAALSVPLSVKSSIFGLDMKIRRGDILYVDLGVQYQGSIQGSMRPVVVVSNNMANKHSTVITVVPLSTKINKKRNLPTHVFVSAYKSEGLEQPLIMAESLRTWGRLIKILSPELPKL